MMITIEQARPKADFPRIAELLTIEMGEVVTDEELFEEDDEMLPNDVRHHLVAKNASEKIIGYGRASRFQGEPDGYFHLRIFVDPAHRRQGIGTALFNELNQFVSQREATKLFTSIREKSNDCMPFAEQHGFQYRNQMFMSRIDIAAFDESKFTHIIEAVEASGIRLTSLSAEGNTDHARRQLYEINHIASIDDPAATDTGFPPFEDYAKTILDAHWFQSDGQFMAFDGDKAVGLSAVSYFEENNVVWSMLSGVAHTHRGRKIAQALKLMTIRFAKEKGVAHLNTQNDSLNEPMLAVNHKLGFERQEGLGSYGLVKDLV